MPFARTSAGAPSLLPPPIRRGIGLLLRFRIHRLCGGRTCKKQKNESAGYTGLATAMGHSSNCGKVGSCKSYIRMLCMCIPRTFILAPLSARWTHHLSRGPLHRCGGSSARTFWIFL